MPAPDRIKRLIEVFERNLPAYKNSGYKEAQLRSEFIEPFFEELGWDVRNKQGWAEAYKDVITEDAIKVGGYTKAPDYCFRVGGARKFFLEAKKPSVDIKEGVDPAYQLRRYAWSAGLPLSVLTDFEEFAVYNCRVRPQLKDKPGKDRVMYVTYQEYVGRWDEIAAVFSRKAVMEGLFDKYAESVIGRRTTQEVDDEFLKEIEIWRTLLAKNIAIRNPSLAIRELNYAVEKTIDRIIFLRICEDRGIEQYGQLQALLNGQNSYGRLAEIYQKADEKYNSGLFHFREEKEMVTPPDLLTPRIKIDDQALKEILKNLYYPESPYEFSVLGVDILGNIYEQFLGKVIRLTAGHHAVVEEKPEVRKAGGVYYTPTYIVDYIVKNTVGKRCEEKTPKQIEKLKILDPACGSGSFLIGAYTYLLTYHRDWYVKYLLPERGFEGVISKAALRKLVPGEKPEMPIYQGRGGQWYLSTREKKRILLNNIHGVDIDIQAVEVTKLSLLLKVLENENQDTLDRQMKLWRERALPDLGNNIKCGNSLIGPDIFEMDLEPAVRRGRPLGRPLPGMGTQLTPDDRERINAFDWNAEFPAIMTSGGFDVVIGNPPYIGFHGFMDEKLYLKSHFVSASGKFDIYLTFIERGVALLRSGGYFGYICPTNFMKRDHGSKLRVHLKDNVLIREICDFEDVQIFKGALNYTGIFMFERNRPSRTHAFIYKRRSLADSGISMQQADLSADAWVVRRAEANLVVRRVSLQRVDPLEKLTQGISEGIVTGENSVFLIPKDKAKKSRIEGDMLHACIRGREIRRYYIEDIMDVIIYPYHLDAGRTVVFSEAEIRNNKPRTYAYLTSRRDDLSGRSYFDKSRKLWYELWCQRDLRNLMQPKIVVSEMAEGNRFAIAGQHDLYGDTVCGIVLQTGVKEDLKYVLGLLNSRLIEFYYKQTTVPKASGFFIYKTMFLKLLPIRRIDFSKLEDKIAHDRLVSLVDQLLDLHKKLTTSKTPDEKTRIERQIKTTDGQIDLLVYELYGLTEEEIRIVEGGKIK